MRYRLRNHVLNMDEVVARLEQGCSRATPGVALVSVEMDRTGAPVYNVYDQQTVSNWEFCSKLAELARRLEQLDCRVNKKADELSSRVAALEANDD